MAGRAEKFQLVLGEGFTLPLFIFNRLDHQHNILLNVAFARCPGKEAAQDAADTVQCAVADVVFLLICIKEGSDIVGRYIFQRLIHLAEELF